MWLEMSRDETHGGAGWEFGTCLWSPTTKRNGESWPFWDLLLEVKQGDTVFHLRGMNQHARFVGFSTAASDGHVTSSRPPEPREWEYATSFNRVFLRDFTQFAHPVSLSFFWREHDAELRKYFQQNKMRDKPMRKHIFFVEQSGRLQCLNGAYFSEIDHELAELILLRKADVPADQNPNPQVAAVTTDAALRMAWVRIGQDRFSAEVRRNYESRCCFPDCNVSDSALLVASHIGRWTDVRELRGEVSNGLCFCLMHDKAFECGLFTLDSNFAVRLHRVRTRSVKWAETNLKPFEGRTILLGSLPPSRKALRFHWERIRFSPTT